MRTTAVLLLTFLLLGCGKDRETRNCVGPCETVCGDWNKVEGEIKVPGGNCPSDCRPSWMDEAAYGLCWEKVATGGLVCYYNCPLPPGP